MIGSAAAMLPGVVRYEALMAVRQRLLWVVLGPMAALIAFAALASAGDQAENGSARVAIMALALSALYTMGVGVALTDCVARHRAGLGDVLETTPAGPTVRLLGAVGGPLAVALIPAGVILLLVGAVNALADASAAPLGAAIVAFLTTVAPGALALTALAALLGLWLPVVFARIAVVVCWGWATLVSPALSPLPTVTGTVLSPLGGYPAVTWLGAPSTWADRGDSGALGLAPTDGAALLNLGATLLVGVVLLTLTRALLGRPHARQEVEAR